MITIALIQAQKKGRPKSPKMPCVLMYLEKLWFFPLVRVFPDKNSKPYKKHHHQAYRQHSGEHHIIDKHDRPPALALLR